MKALRVRSLESKALTADTSANMIQHLVVFAVRWHYNERFLFTHTCE